MGIGHTAHIAPVIVTKQDQHVVRDFHTFIIIIQHFLIERPYLWRLLGGPFGHIGNNLTLVFHNQFHQFRIGFCAHSLITVTTHTDSHYIISAFHALNTFAEEAIQILLVRVIVPCAPTLSVASVLLMVACHWLMMGSTHHDAHFIGSLQIFGIIGIESPPPHGRPHKVSFHAENQLEYLFIETVVAIVRAESILHP